MSRNYQKNKYKKNDVVDSLKTMLIFAIAIVIVLIVVVTSLKNITSDSDEIAETQSQADIQKQQEEALKKTEEEVKIAKLSEMAERDRMEVYFSEFISAVEDGNYEIAYAMLYDDFKNSYFPNLSDFEEYAKKTFPKNMTIKHENFERNGNIYIMFVELSDFLTSKTKGKEMRFVIKEEKLNDFVMSFSVI